MKLSIEYDSASDSLYIRLDAAAIVESEAVDPRVILDFDAHGQITGVELRSIGTWVDREVLSILAEIAAPHSGSDSSA